MGFCEDTLSLEDELIEYIIETYTAEPGVRKLKEMMFDLFGEINIELMKHNLIDIAPGKPIIITKDLLEKKYFKNHPKTNDAKIHKIPKIGIMNGLWANALGKGGIIPIECVLFPSSAFLDLKLTGLQGDVMKESMEVAKSLAWQLTALDIKKEWLKNFEETKCQGLHIHCPDGSVSKDGPSAGAAITIAIFSVLNKMPINNELAITGEINLQGNVTPIGGLSCKILGGIRAGVKHFIYPEQNQSDFDNFMEKSGSAKLVVGIKFTAVKSIQEILDLAFIQ
jgi:ATP-dependent Lon protease